MKRLVLVMFMVSAVITGCGNTKKITPVNPVAASPPSVNDVINSQIEQAAGAKTSDAVTASTDTPAVDADHDVDIDLSKMSSTLIYSEVSNMVASPNDYKGKSVRMVGFAASYFDIATGKTYHACIIPDATACCSQGIEYELKQGEYPSDEGMVAVEGVFDTYSKDEMIYCVLKNAVLL